VAFLAAKWRTLEGWIGSRSSAAALFVLALAVYGFESAFLPAYPGRDMARYLQTFFQLGYHVPLYPPVLNTRGPLSAIGVAVPLEIGGWAAEIWLALLYAFSIVAWSRIALTFGSRAALLTAVLLLIWPGYGILFHQLASDSLFAAAFAGWALLGSRAIQRPSVKAFALVGVAIGVLVLVRPANQVLLLIALLPLILRAPWRNRLAWAASCYIAGVVVSQSWKIYAYLKWGNVVLLKPSTGLFALALVLAPFLLPAPWRARAAVAIVPLIVVAVAVKGVPGESPSQYVSSVVRNESNQFLYRSFELDRIMSPDNGPASRRVAEVVKRDLLRREPYRSYGVDVDEFFSSGSDRIFGDMKGVVRPADLSAATREAIRRHPREFVSSIAHTVFDQLARRPVYAPEPASPSRAPAPVIPASQTTYVTVDGHRLPKPSEGQPIPASAIGPALWTPGGTAQEVWTSPTEHHTVFSNPRDKRRSDKLGNDTERLANRIPTRDGSQSVIHRMNQASHRFPPPLAWLLIGAVTLAWRRPRNALVALAPSVAGLIVILATNVVAPAVAEYAAPVSPAFVMLTAVGIVGAPVRRGRLAAAPLLRLTGLAAGMAAAVWAVKIYYDSFKAYAGGAGAQHDLAVFLGAAGKVLHTASPYTYEADKTFAYPPFLAWLISPLHPLSSSAAAIVWTVLSLAMVAAALRLLGLRDWRCYALAGVFLFTRSAVDLGTVGPLLLLAVAAAWHSRDRLIPPAFAVGAAVALKLFLWPLVAWLALIRRSRSALASVGFALAFVVLPWAAIGFHGITDYPRLLHRLSDDEASSSYSVTALAVRAHLPRSAGFVLSVVVALALLAAAVWIARDRRQDARDRDVAVLTLALAAALAFSPIVWMHYFLLLLVPLALTRPRLSALWFVPLAYSPLRESAWPAGSTWKLALALAATCVLLGAGVARAVPGRTWARRRTEGLVRGRPTAPELRTGPP
jgi:Glycosyltransferase family 87/Dolichyl-phosphate-mannose-protein mannosyltransferase